MYAKQTRETPQLPCACCNAPSAGATWDVPICEHHWAILAAQMPSAGDVTAQMAPDEIEKVVKHEFMPPTVFPKPGALERHMRAWLADWVTQQKGTLRLVGKQ